MQFDPIDREGMEAPMSAPNKDGVYQCKKHSSTSECAALDDDRLALTMSPHSACSQCFGWKKQITRLRTAAKKNKKGSKQ